MDVLLKVFFVAPDRMGKISKFNFDAYAIIEANPAQGELIEIIYGTIYMLMRTILSCSKPTTRNQDCQASITDYCCKEEVRTYNSSGFGPCSFHGAKHQYFIPDCIGFIVWYLCVSQSFKQPRSSSSLTHRHRRGVRHGALLNHYLCVSNFFHLITTTDL